MKISIYRISNEKFVDNDSETKTYREAFIERFNKGEYFATPKDFKNKKPLKDCFIEISNDDLNYELSKNIKIYSIDNECIENNRPDKINTKTQPLISKNIKSNELKRRIESTTSPSGTVLTFLINSDMFAITTGSTFSFVKQYSDLSFGMEFISKIPYQSILRSKRKNNIENIKNSDTKFYKKNYLTSKIGDAYDLLEVSPIFSFDALFSKQPLENYDKVKINKIYEDLSRILSFSSIEASNKIKIEVDLSKKSEPLNFITETLIPAIENFINNAPFYELVPYERKMKESDQKKYLNKLYDLLSNKDSFPNVIMDFQSEESDEPISSLEESLGTSLIIKAKGSSHTIENYNEASFEEILCRSFNVSNISEINFGLVKEYLTEIKISIESLGIYEKDILDFMVIEPVFEKELSDNDTQMKILRQGKFYEVSRSFFKTIREKVGKIPIVIDYEIPESSTPNHEQHIVEKLVKESKDNPNWKPFLQDSQVQLTNIDQWFYKDSAKFSGGIEIADLLIINEEENQLFLHAKIIDTFGNQKIVKLFDQIDNSFQIIDLHKQQEKNIQVYDKKNSNKEKELLFTDGYSSLAPWLIVDNSSKLAKNIKNKILSTSETTLENIIDIESMSSITLINVYSWYMNSLEHNSPLSNIFISFRDDSK